MTDVKKNSYMEVINLTADDPTLLMQNIEQDTQDGIVKYGVNDDQFDYLLRMYVQSTTNNAVINAIVLLIFGKGLNVQGIMSEDDVRKIVKDFYLFGNAAIQIVNGVQMHVPVNFIRAEEVDEEGIINNYFFNTDWSNDNLEHVEIPNWEVNPNAARSIYYLRPYTPTAFYYNLPSYQGALFYAELEEKVAQYLLNTVDNSFSVLKMINFNNGVGDEDSRRAMTKDIKDKTTGVKGDKVVVTFNEDKEHATEIVDITVDNAADQYEFVSKESQNKIIVGHSVTSPLLLGIRDASGFSSNADELESAKDVFMEMKIIPNQDFIANAIGIVAGRDDLKFLNEEVVEVDPDGEVTDVGTLPSEADKQASYNGAQIASSLEIMQSVKDGVLTEDQAVTFLIQMLQFDPNVAKGLFTGDASEEITELRAQKFGSDKDALQEFISLGSEELEGYELFHSSEVDYGFEDEFDELLVSHFDDRTLLGKAVDFVSTGKASPRTKSSQDREEFAVRYRYKGDGKGKRDFCTAMSAANKLYRKEDIINMRHKPVNPGFGEKGKNTYDIWLYKGGARCHHAWIREIHLKTEVSDKSRVQLGDKISVAQARRLGTVEKNNPKVAKHPNDMPRKGFSPNNTNLPEDAK